MALAKTIMSDLSALYGRKKGGFCADTRFAGLENDPAAIPGRSAFTPKLDTHTPPAPEPEPEPEAEPAPDPIALARAEAYTQGVDDTLAQVAAHVEAQDAARAAITLSFSRLDAELAETLRQRLLETVIALCEATLKPLAVDKDLLAARVARAVGMFTRADDERVIRLHPDDLDLVLPQLPADWTFRPDPALERGAIRVETQDGGTEDGPAQWRRAISEALDLG